MWKSLLILAVLAVGCATANYGCTEKECNPPALIDGAGMQFCSKVSGAMVCTYAKELANGQPCTVLVERVSCEDWRIVDKSPACG